MAKKEENKAEKMPAGKKIFSVLGTVLTWLLVIASVAMMAFTIVSVNTFDRNDRDVFGYKMYIVRSDSMSATDFDAGDLILVKEVDPSELKELKEGDIISFTSTDISSFGETITHKIRKLTQDAEGNPGFVTYGTTTNSDDTAVVTYPYVLGRYEMRIPKLGTFFTFLKTTPGYICCILLPFLLLILSQGYRSIRLFRQYKSEQMEELESKRAAERAELEAERAAVAEERKRQEEMMQKLLEMQAALQSKDKEKEEEPVETPE